jgi:hypothetical protein
LAPAKSAPTSANLAGRFAFMRAGKQAACLIYCAVAGGQWIASPVTSMPPGASRPSGARADLAPDHLQAKTATACTGGALCSTID